MKIYQNILDETLEKVFNPTHLMAIFIAERIREKGVEISEEEILLIENQIIEQRSKDTTILNLPGKEDIDVNIDISNPFDLDSFVEKLKSAQVEMINHSIEIASENIFRKIKEAAQSSLKRKKSAGVRFSKELLDIWERPLATLEVLVGVAEEVGKELNDKFILKESCEDDSVSEVVAKILARSCQICHEIILLLSAGYADGANARWRTLHELVVVGFFIERNGQEVARRYLAHQAVESYKSVMKFRTYQHRLNHTPITEIEFDLISQEKEDAVQAFGKDFYNEYGWASICFDNNKNPKFFHIAESVSLDHLFPYYKRHVAKVIIS